MGDEIGGGWRIYKDRFRASKVRRHAKVQGRRTRAALFNTSIAVPSSDFPASPSPFPNVFPFFSRERNFRELIGKARIVSKGLWKSLAWRVSRLFYCRWERKIGGGIDRQSILTTLRISAHDNARQITRDVFNNVARSLREMKRFAFCKRLPGWQLTDSRRD